MRKEDIKGTIIYIVMLVIVILVAFYVIQPNFHYITNNLSQGGAIACVVLSLVIGLFLNALLIEFGHLLGAKLGGYEVYLCNILGFCFYKKEKDSKKKSFKFAEFDGISGETKVVLKKEKGNPRPYILLPILFILIEAIILLVFITLINDSSTIAYLKYSMIICLTIGGILVLYDYIPMELDSLTDGYKYVVTSKKINIEAYDEYLRIQHELFYGSKDLNFKVFDEINDYTSKINLLSLYRLVSENKIDEALELVNKIIDGKVGSTTKEYALLNKFYLLCLKKENVKEFYDSLSEDTKKDIKSCKTLLGCRCYLGYLLNIDKAESELNFVKSKVKTIAKKSKEDFSEEEIKLFDLLSESK